MPIKKVTIRENSPPWLNNHILTLREEKNRIHYLAKHANTPTLWALFRKARNSYTDAIRKQKQKYTQNLDNRISNKANFGNKQSWKLVNNFMKDK